MRKLRGGFVADVNERVDTGGEFWVAVGRMFGCGVATWFNELRGVSVIEPTSAAAAAAVELAINDECFHEDRSDRTGQIRRDDGRKRQKRSSWKADRKLPFCKGFSRLWSSVYACEHVRKIYFSTNFLRTRGKWKTNYEQLAIVWHRKIFQPTWKRTKIRTHNVSTKPRTSFRGSLKKPAGDGSHRSVCEPSYKLHRHRICEPVSKRNVRECIRSQRMMSTATTPF